MAYIHDTGAISRLRFLAPVSGTCVMHIWDRIRLIPDSGHVLNRTESGVHMTEMIMIYSFSTYLWLQYPL